MAGQLEKLIAGKDAAAAYIKNVKRERGMDAGPKTQPDGDR